MLKDMVVDLIKTIFNYIELKEMTIRWKQRGRNMEINYERNIENMIDDFVKEAIRNSKTYGEAKEYVSKRVSHNELGSVIKKIAYDKIEYLATHF